MSQMTTERLGQGHPFPDEDRAADTPSMADLGQPTESVLGLDAARLRGLARALVDTELLPDQARHVVGCVPVGIEIVAWLDRRAGGEEASAADITRTVSGFSSAAEFISRRDPEGLLGGLGARVVEARVLKQQAITAERARKAIDRLGLETKIERDVQVLAIAPDPRMAVEDDFRQVGDDVRVAIETARQARVARLESGQKAQLPPPPPGVKGLVVRAYRKIRSFFGFFKAKPTIIQEATADDAAYALEKVGKDMIEHSVTTEERTPIVSAVLDYIPLNKLKMPSAGLLSFAPEIALRALFSFAGEITPDDEVLIAMVERNRSDIRSLADRFNLGQDLLAKWRNAAKNVPPAVLAAIPTEGRKVQEFYERATRLLYTKPAAQPETPYQKVKTAAKAAAITKWQSWRDRRRRTQTAQS